MQFQFYLVDLGDEWSYWFCLFTFLSILHTVEHTSPWQLITMLQYVVVFK